MKRKDTHGLLNDVSHGAESDLSTAIASPDRERDQFLDLRRTQADFESYQKRVRREREEEHRYQEDRNMILSADQMVVHRNDVVERPEQEFRKQTAAEELLDVVDGASWDVVDQASWESFPASDPPPWTLGYTGPPRAD